MCQIVTPRASVSGAFPRGAKKLGRLILSPLAGVNQRAYQQGLLAIATGRTIAAEVRHAAAQLLDNARQWNKLLV